MEQARSMLNRLSVPERQQLLEEIAREAVPIAPGIYRTPGVCGGDACIGRTRIPVWLLEEGRRNGMSDQQLLESHPEISAADLTAAWSYVRDHREEIDRLIEENTNF